MAVAMNTGGYFRSDFMISDAAIPMRLDELEAEQSAKFAEILGGFGAADSSAEMSENVEKALDYVISAENEILPEEAADEMLAAFVKAADSITDGIEKPAIVKNVPQKKTDEEPAKSESDMMMFMANSVIIGNAAEEMSALAAPTVQETATEVTVQPAGTAQTDNNIVDAVQNVSDLRFAETEQAVQTVQTVAAEPTEAVAARQEKTEVRTDNRDKFVGGEKQDADSADTVTARRQAVPSESSDNRASSGEHSDTQNSGYGRENDSELAQAIGSEKAEVLAKAAEKGEISQPQVRTFAAKTDVPTESSADVKSDRLPEPVRAEEQPETPAVQTTMRSKISSASEELEMLKLTRNAHQPEKTEQADNFGEATVQAAPQTVQIQTAEQTDAPEIDRGEVVRQTAELVRTAVTENTENPEKTEYSMTLDPEDLGKITVKLSKAADGAVSVTIAAERSSTQRILEQNSAMLQDSLKNSGVRLESWQTVSGSRQENYAQDYNGSSKNPYYREGPQQKPDEDDGSSFADLIAAM